MNKVSPASPGLLSLGRVAGAHGVRGALKIRGVGGGAAPAPGFFAALGEVEIGGRRYTVQAASQHQRQTLLQLEGVADRDQAEALIGQEVKGESSRFPPLPEGEYYWFQVLGLPVLHAGDGRLLGHLAEILPTAGHDVYVVRQGKQEVMLPAVEEVITEINLEQGWIKVQPPPGLLEADAD